MHPIEIICQGGGYVSANKPGGLPTQAPVQHASLQAFLRNQLCLDRADYLEAVHRLDRPVSGVVLFATSKKSARLLSEQFASRLVKKAYLAVVEGDPFDNPIDQRDDRIANGSDGERCWNDWVAKIPDHPEVRVVEEGATGAKQATTFVRVLAYDTDTNRSLVRLRPATGRMHQLRVQLSARGAPIVGDIRYGAESTLSDIAVLRGGPVKPAAELGAEKADRGEANDGYPASIALHAESLEFRDPKTASWVLATAPWGFDDPARWQQSRSSELRPGQEDG
ncbi:MAG: RluA family pseudouridine synthase [Planctomycetota bacterium]